MPRAWPLLGTASSGSMSVSRCQKSLMSPRCGTSVSSASSQSEAAVGHVAKQLSSLRQCEAGPFASAVCFSGAFATKQMLALGGLHELVTGRHAVNHSRFCFCDVWHPKAGSDSRCWSAGTVFPEDYSCPHLCSLKYSLCHSRSLFSLHYLLTYLKANFSSWGSNRTQT